MAVRFGFIPVRPGAFLREEAFNQTVGSYILALWQMGGERWSAETLDNPASLFYLMAIGGTEKVLLDLRAERHRAVPDEPVVLLSHPGGGPIDAGQGPGFAACAAGQSLDIGQRPPQRSSSGLVGDDDRSVITQRVVPVLLLMRAKGARNA